MISGIQVQLLGPALTRAKPAAPRKVLETLNLDIHSTCLTLQVLWTCEVSYDATHGPLCLTRAVFCPRYEPRDNKLHFGTLEKALTRQTSHNTEVQSRKFPA
jgi:hypothetical protein